MRWVTIAAVLCTAMTCVSTVMADGTPRFKSAVDENKEISQALDGVFSTRADAATATPVQVAADRRVAPHVADREAAKTAIETTPPIRAAGIERSEDGRSFRINASPDMRPTAAMLEGRQATPAGGGGPRGGGCGDPESGSCCEPNWTPYCDDAECCEIVCYELGMWWCCEEGEEGGWGDECVDVAQQYCDCAPPTGACCFGDVCVDMEYAACAAEGGRWFRDWNCGDLDFACPACPPEESLFTQDVQSYFPGYFTMLSDLDRGARVSERFWDVHGDICGVKWYGTPTGIGGWECDENPMTFDIRFYEDNGGVPGAEVCGYTVTATGTLFSADLWWFEYSVEFDTCCTLENGFISIAGTGGPDCLFGWIGSEEGDGTHCRWVEDEEEGYWDCPPPGEFWSVDVNVCLLGTLYPGACCDEAAGTCQDNVEAIDCPATSRFMPSVSCAELDPPCGDLAGACCIDEPPYCYIEAEALCEGSYLGHGTTCDPTDCNANGVPDACDIAGGYSDDCDENGVPDECDIAAGGDDYDGNGVLDACEPDCNGNGVVDACDLDCATGNCAAHPVGCGSSTDCQPNDVPDDCELGTTGSPILWDGGPPNDERTLRSHYGGQVADALTVDDISLPGGGTINGLHWYVEDDDQFDWQGQVRIEIFADNGAGGPDDASQVVAMSVPTDGGSVIRTPVGPGSQYPHRYRFDVYGLDLPLGPGIWWVGLAPESVSWDGASRWCASQGGEDVVMGESHFRAPSMGYTLFAPWSELSSAPIPWDASFTVTTTRFGADCNSNGVPDDCDIADCDGSAWCQDCQGNGIPDGCEPDCNGNGIPDQCDVLFCDGSGWCGDCNWNEIPDECDVPPLGAGPDCNENGVPDECDIADGTSPDCNENGVPDECDIASGASDDYDGNGNPDECDPDCNGNGIVDACDVDCNLGNCASHPDGCGASIDCQPDGIPDECQLGAPSTYLTDDGVHDNSAGLSQGGTLAWLNWFTVEDDYGTITAISLAWGNVPDGLPCTVYLWSDPNGDGDPSDAQVFASATTVVANAGTDVFATVDIPDTYVGPAGTSFFAGAMMDHQPDEYPAAMDYEGWGQGWIAGDMTYSLDPNDLAGGSTELQPYIDSWLVRAEAVADNDCNDNDVPDECDIASGFSQDCDSNGLPDECEWLDCNSNGVHDPCDILTCDGSSWCSDCNGNGIPDECDVASGTSEDCQPNGIPDECEEDCNENGIPDDCDLRDCDGSVWCDDCNEDGILDECQAGEPGGVVYQWDDGSAENSLGIGEPAEIAWIQHFVAMPGSETIVAVSTCFGNSGSPGLSGVEPGAPFRVFIWDDPEGLGDPMMGAVLLGSAQAFADEGSIDTDVLQEVAIGPVTVSGSFFIGAAVESAMFPAPMDEDGELAHESWIALGWPWQGGFDPDGFSADNMDEVEPSNWLLRAISEGGAAPNDCNANGIPDDCELCGDLDGDGDVDYDDYVIFLDAFGGETDGTPAEDWCCDYDDSGAVGMADFDAWLDCYRDFISDPYSGPPTNPDLRKRDATATRADRASKDTPQIRPAPSLTPRP